ncbi:unnamed protein product [Laminaria digitata]
MAAHAFQVDPFASKLKEGGRPDCGGLVLVVGWGWGEDSSTRYEILASDMAALCPDSLHVYDAGHLHCTVATLSSFKNSKSVFFKASAADRDRAIQAWNRALTAAFARIKPAWPFELVFRLLEISPAATFLKADDASNTMETLRSAVKEAAEDPLLHELSAELEDKYRGDDPEILSLQAAIHVPDIIHSTVMRLASEPPNARRLAEELAGLSARWAPATVRVDKISLVYEKHPYMHMNRADGLAHSFVSPFC